MQPIPNAVPSANILDHCDVFTRERSPEEIDLVTKCRDLLIENGLVEQVVANFDTHYLIHQAAPLNPEGQRFLLNRFWTFQFNKDPAGSQQARFALIPDGDYNGWLRSFRSFVLPYIRERGLPIAL